MRPSLILLIAIFSNFFGREIMDGYARARGLPFVSLIGSNEYYWSSLVEMFLIFLLCVGIYFFHTSRRFSVAAPRSSQVAQGFHLSHRDGFYYISVVFFVIVSFYSLAGFNVGGVALDRGVGQFDRGLGDALARFKLLMYPWVMYCFVVYKRSRSFDFVVLLFIAAVSLPAISKGDRRDVFYVAIAFIFYVYSVGGGAGLKGTVNNLRLAALGLIAIIVLLFSYYVRGADFYDFDYSVYFIGSGTIGGLGLGGILWHVKSYVADTGYLYGQTFLSYIIGLFIPSFVLYLLGLDEFYLRSSYMFNDYFNENENMGYDFMMLGDFYWNFGYFGYFLFICLFYAVVSLIARYEKNCNPVNFCLAVILTCYFVAGQRSDFGFFLKTVIYSGLFLYFLHFIKRSRFVWK